MGKWALTFIVIGANINAKRGLIEPRSVPIHNVRDGIGIARCLYIASEMGGNVHHLNDRKLVVEGLWMRLANAWHRSEEARSAIISQLTHKLSCNG